LNQLQLMLCVIVSIIKTQN